MKLDVLHRARLIYSKLKKSVDDKKQTEDMPNMNGILGNALKANFHANQMSMHKVPHMDGTNGHVPSPGKPKWEQL